MNGRTLHLPERPGTGASRSPAALLRAGAIVRAVAPPTAALPGIAQTLADRAQPDGVSALIDNVIHDPEVTRRIADWGLSAADVKHDVDSMSPEERARLAYSLARQWRGNETHTEADLQAQFLVTVSLMRDSTLFASVISSDAFRLR